MSETSEEWPGSHAVSVVLRPDPGGEGPTTISVRHPTAPYKGLVGVPKAPFHVTDISERNVYDLVTGYLEWLTDISANRHIPELGFSLAPAGEKGSKAVQKLTCLPFEDQEFPWRTSFWFNRTDHTLVVLAAPELLSDDVSSRRGIRVVAHYCESSSAIHVTSMSACLPPGAVVQLKSAASERMVGPVKHEGVRVSVVRSRDPVSQKPKSSNGGVVHSISLRRPTGDGKILEQYFPEPLSFNKTIVPSEVGFVQHQPSNLVRADMDSGLLGEHLAQQNEGLVKRAPINPQPVRSDGFAADQAYYNANLLFDCLRRYSIRTDSYFRSAKLPLAIHYRSGMPYGPGRDGQTVNAAVQPKEPEPGQPNEWRRHQIAPCVCQSRPKLHMHFALANRSHRGRKRWNGKERSTAQHLGIVADPRWVWHEFGHVLLMATTGELEMRFSHSPGDALAAIVADPASDFVEDTEHDNEDEKEKKRRWRGATFPWVFLPRRHDRSVKRGWSWSGAMHRPLRELPDGKQPRRKGYRSEQILSTSLFRIYLCLGGMTHGGDVGSQHRHAASNYTLYLIMKGLGLLGDARIVAANHPDQLVSALVDADIGTQVFHIDEPLLIGPFPGGFAHKVIRWAFEAQGLYADGTIDNNDKGEPPAVDIYIEDRRWKHDDWCGSGVEHGKGSYVPVSLEGPKKGTDHAGQPDWFSTAIEVNDKEIEVRVGNRGSEKAKDVCVRVFYIQWDVGDDFPSWEAGGKNGWTEAGPEGGCTRAEINKWSDIGPFTWKPPEAKTYLILAEASCAADRANTCPESGLPCSRGTMPLAELVANDNNLGLTLWRSP